MRRLPAPKSFKQSKRITTQQKEDRPQKNSRSSLSIKNTSKNSDHEPLTPITQEEVTFKQEPIKLNETPSALDLYCKDLTAEAEKGKLDPVIGRESEIKAIT